jgi:replicative DNA helicase
MTGVPTGYVDLDKVLLGLQPGTLNIVGARPAMGKSAFALGLAVHAAQTLMKPVLFFSLEMGKAELAQRILSSEARVDSTLLRTGRPSANDWTKISHAVGRLDIPLIIDDSAGTSVGQIRAKARRTISRDGGLSLIVIDYLQLMSGSGGSGGDNRATELGEISRGLKMLAKELQCPVIALSQLNRSVEQRTDKRPMMSDLRESGAIEQDADVVGLLYKPAEEEEEISDTRQPVESHPVNLLIAKQRNGPTGTVKLTFLKHITKFESYAASSNGDY